MNIVYCEKVPLGDAQVDSYRMTKINNRERSLHLPAYIRRTFESKKGKKDTDCNNINKQ